MLIAGLAQAVQRAKFLLTDNSTVILTGVGVVGTVGTAVLTGRASFRAAEIIRTEEADRVSEVRVAWDAKDESFVEIQMLSKTEKVKLVWPHYIPAAVVGVGTITAIVMANRISSKQIAALAVASGVSERALQEYKAKVVEKLGDRQETAIRDEIAQDRVTNNPPSGQVFIAGSGDVLCFDDLTGRYFNSTVEDIKRAENKVNYAIIHDDYCSLSFFFDEIGLRPTTYSDMVGWNINTQGMEVKFTSTITDDNRPCLVLGYTSMPVMDYDKPWAIAGG